MNKNNVKNYGVGDEASPFRVYMGNVPDYADFAELDRVRPLNPGDVAAIGNHCGNGWRKVFNVYAKLVYALKHSLHFAQEEYVDWQQWRDRQLLQKGSNSALLFSPLELAHLDSSHIHIVMGRTWAKECGLTEGFNWLNHEFAVHTDLPVVICPYFDYRQLSNQKIVFLCELLNTQLAALRH